MYQVEYMNKLSKYNNMAQIGDITKVTHGILKSLQKPNKAKGPPLNLKPIILLSSLARSSQHVSPTESKIDWRQKYHHRKQPTDQIDQQHVFTSKLIFERTITARNESTHLIMLDMSKAFDSINRNQLNKDLRNTAETDELHIISTLLNVSLSVRCENTLSEVFETDTGAPQGDCTSALQFTYYLAKMLEPAKPNQLTDHSMKNRM